MSTTFNPELELYIPITKAAEVNGQRLVYGTLAAERPDRMGETFDYNGSKPYFKAWSDSVAKDSGGKSFGNCRKMHQMEVVGHAPEPLVFDDAQKTIEVCTQVSDDTTWQQIQDGELTGYSIGGKYVSKSGKRYVANPFEYSLVDRPAMPGATLTVFKADGTTEVHEFKQYQELEKADQDFATVHGQKVPKSEFAYAPEGSSPSEWKFPIMDASHVRNALARINQADLPADAKAGVKAKIDAAAKKFGIKVSDDAKKCAEARDYMTSESVGKSAVAQATAEYLALDSVDNLTGELEKAISAFLEWDATQHTESNEMELSKAQHASVAEHLANAKSAHTAMGDHIGKCMKALGCEGDDSEVKKTVANETQNVSKDELKAALDAQADVFKGLFTDFINKMAGESKVESKGARNGGETSTEVTKAQDNGDVKKSTVVDADEDLPRPGSGYAFDPKVLKAAKAVIGGDMTAGAMAAFKSRN